MKNSKVENLQIDLPCFPGFYHSFLYSEDQEHDEEMQFVKSEVYEKFDDFPEEIIDKFLYSCNIRNYPIKFNFDEYAQKCGKQFAETFEDYVKDVIPSFHLIFKDVWSPSFYNYQTDRIVSDVSFDFEEMRKYLKENILDFKDFLDRNKNNFDEREQRFPEYYTEMDLEEIENGQDYYFLSDVETMIRFVLENKYGESEIEYLICCDVLERVSMYEFFEIQKEFEAFFDSEKASEIKKEYARLKKQGEDYLKIMKDSKYIPVVKENMKNIVSEMADEITKYIEEYEEIA